MAADDAVTPHLDGSEAETVIECGTGNEYDGRLGLRIAALFIILVGSTFGAALPIFARRHANRLVPDSVFFVIKFFGSGVIIATAFIHLLAPAHEALSNPCLTGPITEYPWVEGITLMTSFVICFIQLMTMHYARSRASVQDYGGLGDARSTPFRDVELPDSGNPGSQGAVAADKALHIEPGNHASPQAGTGLSSYSTQLTTVFILEFGVIFHSVLIGLTLAVAGDEFRTLFIVLVFHQTFEGLGIGSRLATIPWPVSKRWTPYALALAYGLSTPIAIAVGLGVRNSYPPESRTTLIVSGVLDSISAGILIYTSFVELIAHEILFNPAMHGRSVRVPLSAFSLICLGAGLMASLGRWA